MAIVFPATAQFAEPILTRAAIPKAPDDARLQLLFISPLGAGISQALPEARLEIGLGQGFEAIAQSSRQFAFLEYDNALLWTNRTDIVPAIEVVGSTDTLHWTTELVVQPEVISPWAGTWN